MHGHNIKDCRRKIWAGTFVVYLILAVSLGVSVAYWYILAGAENTESQTAFWTFIIWLVVAVGVVAEIIKKVTISLFRNLSIWSVATFVSILTVMGTYSILDNDKQSELVKQSDGYQLAKNQKSEALKQQAKYAYTSAFSLDDLEKQKRIAGNKARWGTFNRLKKDIEARKKYLSAMSTLKLSNQNIDIGGAGTASSNPFLSNIALSLGISAELLKSLFYLFVTLLLEIAAFWIGGQVERLKQQLELTEIELLDLKIMAKFGISMRDINERLFNNVLLAESDRLEAEKQVEEIRKGSRKKLPAGETASKVKQLRNESQKQQNEAKQPPRPAFNFSPQTAPTITVNTAPIFQPKQAKKQPKQGGGFSFGFIPNNPLKQPNENSLNRLKNSLNRRVVNNSPTALNKAGATIGKTRKTDTPDTGIKGETAQRYRALKKYIQEEIEAGRKKKTKITISYIRTFKYGTKTVGYQTARKYHEALKKEGVIS